MAKRRTRDKQMLDAKRVLALLTPADILVVKLISEAIEELEEHSSNKIESPMSQIRETLVFLPDWLLYRLVQSRGWNSERRTLFLMFVTESYARVEILPSVTKNIDMIAVTSGMVLMTATEILAGRHGKSEMRDIFKTAIDAKEIPEEIIEVMAFYRESDPSLREPTEFDLLRHMPGSHDLAGVLGAR